MKLTTFLLTAAILNVSAKGLSQQVTYSAENAPISNVFEAVKKQTGYVFFFTKTTIAEANPVTIYAVDLPLPKFLDELFKNQPLTFLIENNAVIVTKKAVDIIPSATPQLDAAPIKGFVKDSTGMPLSGATVMNKRTKKTVQTNAKGEFNIEGENGDVLVISYIGFEVQNILVSGPTVFSVLRVSSSPLDEIQIMAYGKTSKRLSTGNISTVKAAEIEKQPVNNPLLALTSRVPGLEIIQSSGIPGSPVKVKIRGTNSLSMNGNDPLFVVDGLPYLNEIGNAGFSLSDYTLTSAFSLINPNDIESIEVLKDADATSIYGSRGANGVILITTKKGKIGTNTINLNVQSGIGQVAHKANLMNVEQYKAMRFEALKNNGAHLNNPYFLEDTTGLPSSYPDLFYWNGNTDWQEEMIGGTARYTDAQATISGGISTMQYLIGGNYHKETTVFPGNSGDQKANVHFNINGSSLNQKFRTSLSGAYMSNWNQYPSQDFTQFITLAPTAPNLLRTDGSLNWEPLTTIYGTSFYTLQNNPYAVLFRPYRSTTNNLISNADISYKILPNFSAKITVGYNRIQSNSFSADPAAAQMPGVTPQRTSTFGSNILQSVITEPQLAYNIVAGKHKIDVLLGGSYQSRETNIALLQARGFSSDELMENQDLAAQYSNRNFSSQYKYTAVFGRLNYNFSDKYLINLNARRDGSSRFGPGKRFGNFGSVGAAWIFSEENFVKKNLGFLSFGKLRASYGSAGNDGINDYAYLERYIATEFNYLDAKGLVSGGLVNKYFHWESIRKAELALELGFLKDRISLQGSYYRNRSSNQLQTLLLPNMAGGGDVIYNSPALIENAGIELMLSTVNIQGRKLKWNSSFNITRSRNKLLAYPNLEGSAVQKYLNYQIGQPIGLDGVYSFLGVDPTSGNYQFKDVNGNPVGGGTDGSLFLRTSVNTNPEFYAGLFNSISYKSISLDFQFQFVKQLGRNYLYSFPQQPGVFSANGLLLSNQPVELLETKHWQQSGDIALIGKFNDFNGLNFGYSEARASDAGYSDASFVRLKNISLSYTLPDAFRKKMRLQNCRIYLQGQNVLTFTHFKGLDPENQSVLSLPPLRVITAGVQIGF